jgi:Carboxypeptidase regulatory-like domain
MNRLLLVLALVAAMFSIQAQAAESQKKKDADSTVRSVQGTVTDPGGKSVPGAVVHLKNTKTLQIRSFITKEDGSYVFHGLSTNVDYELKAEADNEASDSKTLSVFDARNKAVINLKINKK